MLKTLRHLLVHKAKLNRKLTFSNLEEFKKDKEAAKHIKFGSFLKNSLLPRPLRKKFPYLLNNSNFNVLKYKGPDLLADDVPVKWTHNEEVTLIFYVAYFTFYLALLLDYEDDVLELENEVRGNFFLFLFNYPVFYYFFNNSFNQLYAYNLDLKYFIYSYALDGVYNKTYFILFNYYIFSYALNFFVLLNLGLIKYEHDQVLTPIDKWDTIPKMDLDFFDYSEFTGFNISDDALLCYQDNMFYSLCVYEFHLDFIYYFFNSFNLSFFHKLKFKKKIFKGASKFRSYLSKVAYDEIKGSKKDYHDELFAKTYDEFFLMLKSSNVAKLDYYKNMMDVRSFMVKIPYLFFLIYSWYVIYYRSFRYNLYVRSFHFFEEYTCKKKVFILHNNPHGKNKTKVPFFSYQKLWTLNHFKLYIEERFFNKWFLFYSTRAVNLVNFMSNENLVNLKAFTNLLNDFNLNLFLKSNELQNFEYAYEFYYDNLLDILDANRSIEGFRLAMRERTHKFTKKFKLARSSYLELDDFVEAMYTLPFDLFTYYKHFNKVLSFDFLFELHDKIFLDFYFLKDFYSLNNKVNHMKDYKMVNLYTKLVYLSFYIMDPFFFKYFWRKFFPRRLKKLWKASAYLKLIFIQRAIRGNNRLSISNYDFFHHYLNWRADTSTSVQQNNFYKDGFSASLSISNMMAKSRLLGLLYRLKFILNLNNIFSMHKLQYFILLLKTYYVILLNQNIDIIFYMFFFNIAKFLNIQKNISVLPQMSYVIDNNFTYRYYVYTLLFEHNYYIDWFNNRPKRVLWIFHKKDYSEHEGHLFYKGKFNEVF